MLFLLLMMITGFIVGIVVENKIDRYRPSFLEIFLSGMVGFLVFTIVGLVTLSIIASTTKAVYTLESDTPLVDQIVAETTKFGSADKINRQLVNADGTVVDLNHKNTYIYIVPEGEYEHIEFYTPVTSILIKDTIAPYEVIYVTDEHYAQRIEE